MNNPLHNINTFVKPARGSVMAAAIGLMTAFHPLLHAEEDLRAKTQNPVGSLISVPFENNFDFGADNGEAFVMNVQPVIPVRIGDWNLINRVIAPIIRVPGTISGLSDDSAKFRNAEGKQTRQRSFPFGVKIRVCHQRYKDGAAKTGDEYYCTQSKTPAGLHSLISQFFVSPPHRCYCPCPAGPEPQHPSDS